MKRQERPNTEKVRKEVILKTDTQEVLDRACLLLGVSRNQFIQQGIDAAIQNTEYALSERFRDFANRLIRKRLGKRVDLKSRAAIQRHLKKIRITPKEVDEYARRGKMGNRTKPLNFNARSNHIPHILTTAAWNADGFNFKDFIKKGLSKALEWEKGRYLEHPEFLEKLRRMALHSSERQRIVREIANDLDQVRECWTRWAQADSAVLLEETIRMIRSGRIKPTKRASTKPLNEDSSFLALQRRILATMSRKSKK